MPIVLVRDMQTETFRQEPAVFKTGLPSLGIDGIGTRIDPKLFRQIAADCSRWFLILPEEPSCLPHDAELNCETQTPC